VTQAADPSHTAALRATYGITTTYVRRQAHWLASKGHQHATGPTEHAAVLGLLPRVRREG
jgi:hypothetical protein